MERAHGRCESCGVQRPLEWDHVAGRRHIVAEPWASSPYLTVGLCRGCHKFATDEQHGIREFTRRLAVTQLTELAKSQGVEMVFSSDWTELQKIQYFVRELEYPSD